MTSNLRCAIQQPMNYVMRLKAGGRVGCGMQRIAFPKVQCRLNREYAWGSSLKVSGEEESKKNWNFAKLTCLLVRVFFKKRIERIEISISISTLCEVWIQIFKKCKIFHDWLLILDYSFNG